MQSSRKSPCTARPTTAGRIPPPHRCTASSISRTLPVISFPRDARRVHATPRSHEPREPRDPTAPPTQRGVAPTTVVRAFALAYAVWPRVCVPRYAATHHLETERTRMMKKRRKAPNPDGLSTNGRIPPCNGLQDAVGLNEGGSSRNRSFRHRTDRAGMSPGRRRRCRALRGPRAQVPRRLRRPSALRVWGRGAADGPRSASAGAAKR